MGRPSYSNYRGINQEGQQVYQAPNCPHLTTNNYSKMCADCRNAQRREAAKGYVDRVIKDGKQLHGHRAIAEEVLGRPLKANEVVHHIDMDKKNNSHDNLLICTRSYHRFLHNQMERAYAKLIKAERAAMKEYQNAVIDGPPA